MKLDGYIEQESVTARRNAILQRITDEEMESFHIRLRQDRSIRNADSKEAKKDRQDYKLHM